jgi:hypothetical protein
MRLGVGVISNLMAGEDGAPDDRRIPFDELTSDKQGDLEAVLMKEIEELCSAVGRGISVKRDSDSGTRVHDELKFRWCHHRRRPGFLVEDATCGARLMPGAGCHGGDGHGLRVRGRRPGGRRSRALRELEIDTRARQRHKPHRPVAQVEVDAFGRTPSFGIECQDANWFTFPEQQHLCSRRTLRLDPKTSVLDNGPCLDGGLTDRLCTRPVNLAAHLNQLADLDTDSGEQERRNTGDGGDDPGWMHRAPEARDDIGDAVSRCTGDLAFSTAVDATPITFETDLAEPFLTATTALAGLLRGVIGAV